MSGPNIDDILQEGIHGKKEIKPAERRRFLGTIRERIIVALTQSQVRENKVYPELITLMQDHPKAKLYVNGDIDYLYLKKYIEAAQKNKIPYKMVINKEHTTDIGIILAYDYAIDKKEIFLKKEEPTLIKEENKKIGALGRIANLFKGKNKK